MAADGRPRQRPSGVQGEKGTPIKQDVKKGKLRHYYEGIPYNYGMLPQVTAAAASAAASRARIIYNAASYVTIVLPYRGHASPAYLISASFTVPLAASWGSYSARAACRRGRTRTT